MYLHHLSVTNLIGKVKDIKGLTLKYNQIIIETLAGDTIVITPGKDASGEDRLWYDKKERKQ